MRISELKDFFKSADIPKNEILFLHVKLKGISDETAYDSLSKKLIDIIEELYQPKTVLVPTFTYSFTKEGSYNRMSSPSEVGRFSEEIRKQYSYTKRTSNPVFNVIDTSNYFENYDLQEETAFGEDSLMHVLHELGHVVININAPQFISTYLHFLEFHYQVPYRYIKNFTGEVVLSTDMKKQVNFKYHVRDLQKNTSWDREKIKTALFKEGVLQVHNSNGIEVNWSHSKNLEEVLGSKLMVDKNYLLG
jgi:aminoglycoside 3-N-acetyltransferase